MSNSNKSPLSSVDSSSCSQNVNQRYERKSKPSSVELERYKGPEIPSGKGNFSSSDVSGRSPRRSRDRNDRRRRSPSPRHRRSRSRSHGRRRSPDEDRHKSLSRDRRRSTSRDRYRSKSRERRYSPERRHRSRSGERDHYYSRSRTSDRRFGSRDRYQNHDSDYDYYRDRRNRDRNYNRPRDYDRSRRSRSRSYDRRSPRRSSPKRAPDITDMMNSLIQNLSQKPSETNSTAPVTNAVSQAMSSLSSTGFLETVPNSLVGSVLLSNPTLSGLGVPKTIDKIVRELYVGNIPLGLGITPTHLRDFFDLLMTKTGLAREPGSSVLSARLTENSTFGFIELRTPEETDLAMTLNGVPFHGSSLRVSRPKGYAQRFGDASSVMAAKILANSYTGGAASAIDFGGVEGEANVANKAIDDAYVSDSGSTKSNKDVTPIDTLRDRLAYVSNLSKQVTSEQLNQMFGHIGAVENVLIIALENDDMEAYIEYRDSSSVSKAISALNGLPITSRFIKIELATDKQIEAYMKQVSGELNSVHEPMTKDMTIESPNKDSILHKPTCFLELLNVLTRDDLNSASESDLKDINDDVTDECSKYGKVVKTVIPPLLPEHEVDKLENLPPVFVVFENVEHAEACANAIRGKLFDNRPVITRFLSQDEAQVKNLVNNEHKKPVLSEIPIALLSADLD